LVYAHSDPPPRPKGKWHKESRLLAFVLAPEREPVMLALGATGPVEQAVQAWRQAVVRGQAPDAAGAELARRVWQPLWPHLGEAQTVLIAPDGPLTGLPFAALPGSKPGTYLLEERTIAYVTSGRHLLELAADTDRPATGLLALGGLTYGDLPPGPT